MAKGRWQGVIGCCLVMLLWWGSIPPAAAAICRSWHGHSICILRLKRSAKYYWEYRAQVTVDDEIQPQTRYDCRDRTQTPKHGHTTPFRPDSAGAFLCDLMA